MKKRILSAVLTLVMILSLFPVMQLTASAAQSYIRICDIDDNIPARNHKVEVKLRSYGTVGALASGSDCDECYLRIYFPYDTTIHSYSAFGASDGVLDDDPANSLEYVKYTKYFGKNFMKTDGDTITLTFYTNAYPCHASIICDALSKSRTFEGRLSCYVDGKAIVDNDVSYQGGVRQNAIELLNGRPSIVSAKYNLSAKDIVVTNGKSNVAVDFTLTGKNDFGGNITYTVCQAYNPKNNSLGYDQVVAVVLNEKLVQAENTGDFTGTGITLDSIGKKILVDANAFNASKTCQSFRIHSQIRYNSRQLNDGFGDIVNVYSDVITLYPGEATVNYNANGGSGSMASQNITYGTAATLAKNTFTYNPTLTFKSDIGTLDVPSVSVPASFGGWMDKTTTTFNGTTYPYYEFDAAGYANRNGDVLASSAFGNGVYDKEAMLRHYIAHGKNEYENGSANRAAATGYFGTYPDGATVKNLAGESGGVVSLYAKWNYGMTTLPTPTTDGYTFRSWTADLMDIATLTDNLEISDTTRGTIGYNDGYHKNGIDESVFVTACDIYDIDESIYTIK